MTKRELVKQRRLKEKPIVKMCKSYLVFNINKGSMGIGPNGVILCTVGSSYSTQWYQTLEGAQARADELARAGTCGVIFESKEFRQIQPVPVVVERVSCCD